MSLLNLQADFIEHIEGAHGFSSITHAVNLAIYANNIRQSMIHALTLAYPLTKKIIGDNFFHRAAKEYVDLYPSRSPDLHEYGEYFSDFIAEYEPAKDFVYLEDVARFEWACHQIYFAAENTTFNHANLNELTNEQYQFIHFVLHPACRVLRFHYPIQDIIDLCENQRHDHVDLDKGGPNLLITRQQDDIKLITLNDADYVFLSCLNDNMPLAVALEEALAVDDNFNLESKLPEYIQKNIIIDWRVIE